MKYRTFKVVVGVALVGALGGTGVIAWRLMQEPDEPARLATANAPTANAPTTNAPTTNAPTTNTPTTNAPTAVPTAQIRAALEQWLGTHADRGGAMRADDIVPGAPYRATVVRFPEADAVRFSNNPSQWSQIRLDLNRDGVDDEKWLLMNGHTYKREVLAPDGRTVVSTMYFDR